MFGQVEGRQVGRQAEVGRQVEVGRQAGRQRQCQALTLSQTLGAEGCGWR